MKCDAFMKIRHFLFICIIVISSIYAPYFCAQSQFVKPQKRSSGTFRSFCMCYSKREP